jgi:flagellar motor switch protein FliG
MEASTTLGSAAVLVSCLPAAEAEQLLQLMPAEQAAAIRRCAPQDAPAALRIAIARRFADELSQITPSTARRRFDSPSPLPPFHFLSHVVPSRLAAVLSRELPRTTATVLCALPAGKAADVLGLLCEAYQVEVLQQMICGGPVRDDVLRELAVSLSEVVQRHGATACPDAPGRARLAEILRCVDGATRKRLADAARREGIELDDTVPDTDNASNASA